MGRAGVFPSRSIPNAFHGVVREKETPIIAPNRSVFGKRDDSYIASCAGTSHVDARTIVMEHSLKRVPGSLVKALFGASRRGCGRGVKVAIIFGILRSPVFV